MIEGRPVVWLYASAFAKKYDASAIEYLKEHFARDFGGKTPYIVREVSWNVPADSSYAWGAALGAMVHGVAGVGPGYDHRAVPGRQPLVRDREGGKFYARSWEHILSLDPQRRPHIAVVETWNELHEGTDICDSREYGRQYIEMTARYAARFKKGERL